MLCNCTSVISDPGVPVASLVSAAGVVALTIFCVGSGAETPVAAATATAAEVDAGADMPAAASTAEEPELAGASLDESRGGGGGGAGTSSSAAVSFGRGGASCRARREPRL